MAHRDRSHFGGRPSLSGHSGLRQADRPADLWVHGLASVYKLTRLIAASYDSRN
jgi:hypothetical protein